MKTPLLDGLVKEAVTMSQLRRGTKGLANLIKRKSYAFNDFIRYRGGSPTLVSVPPHFKHLGRKSKWAGKIISGGEPYKIVPKNLPRLTTPEAREMFNRSSLLHELAEQAEMRVSKTILPRFFSHTGLKAPLTDLNIAATLKGKGAKEAANLIRALRQPELDRMIQLVPSIKRLNLGHERLSRHAIKGIGKMVLNAKYIPFT